MQRDHQSEEKLPDIIASIRKALFLPQDAKAALDEIIDSPGRHKAVYFHQAAQEQGLLAALTQIAYQKKWPHCVLSLSDPSSLHRLLTDACLQKGGKLQKIKGPLAICIEQGGVLILKRDNVPNNVLEGLNSLWSTDLDEKFHQIPLHPHLRVILISAMTAPQLSPAASGRFQHLLLNPQTVLPHIELKTMASLPESAYIIDLAFQDSLATEEQLIGTLKREEKNYAWVWQEGQLISLLRKHKSQPLTVHFQHADCAQNYLQNLLIKQQAGIHLTANGVSWDLSLLQMTLAPPPTWQKTHPKISQKNLSRVSSQQARHSQKRLYMIHHENHYQQLFSLAGTQIVDGQPEWVLSPGYLAALNQEDSNWVILIAAPLALAQWYCLLTESRILHLWVLEETFIPEIFQDLFQPYTLDSKQSPKDLPKPKPVTHTQFVISKDLNYAIDWFSQRNSKILKIFISAEHNAQNLFNQYDAKKNHSPGLLWQALQQKDREVLLIGLEYHPELAAELQFLWNGISLININGRLEKRTQGRLIILLSSSQLFPGFTCYDKSLFYLGSKQLTQRLKNYIQDPVEPSFFKILAKTLFYIHENPPFADACEKLEISLTYNSLKRLILLYGFARHKKELDPAQAIGHSLYYGLIIRLKHELDTVNYELLLQKIGKFFAPKEIIWPTSHNEWSDRSIATTISLEAYPLVFLAGPTATGKSQIAVQLAKDNNYRIFGPLTLGPDTSFEDMATLVDQWANAKPVKGSRLLLFLDEVTLAAEQSLEWLNGVLGLSLILPNGKHYTLTKQHVVLMGGNLNYAGRTLHRFIRNSALIIPFPAFSVAFLQKQVVKPILEKFVTLSLNLTLADLDLIQETLFELYEKIPLLEPQHRLDARTLTAILAHFEAYRGMDLNTAWQALFHLACLQVVLNGLLPAHQEALRWHLQQKLGYSARFPRPVLSSYLKLKNLSQDSKQKSNLLWLEPKSTRKLAAFYLCDLLVSQYWQKRHQKNPPSIGGVLVLGPTNTGKDYILKAAMRAVNYQPEIDYHSLNAGPFVDIQAIKKKAMTQGLKLHITEVDLWPSGLIEGAFNDVLTGQAPLGFRLYTTANGQGYQDRQSFSAALLSRLQLFHHRDYSLKELKILIQQQHTQLKEEAIAQLMRVHTYFLGDGIASSRHAMQAARLLSEGVPFIQACVRAYADSLRLPPMKAIESPKTPYRLAVIHAYLQIHYSILQPLLRETNSPPCEYNAELKTLTISRTFFQDNWYGFAENSLQHIVLLHLAFPLPEEQIWIAPLVTIIHQTRTLSLLKQQDEKKPLKATAALELFQKAVLSEKQLLAPVWPILLKSLLSPHAGLIALLTCLPQRLIPEDYERTQQNAIQIWNNFYEQVIKPIRPFIAINIPAIEEEKKYQVISLGQTAKSGFSELNKKEKLLGKVEKFKNASSKNLYFNLGRLAYASQPAEFKKNQLPMLPMALIPKMRESDFKGQLPEFRITLEYCQSVLCGPSKNQLGFRLLVPQGMWPRVSHEQKYFSCQQDDNGFYIQFFSFQGQPLAQIDQICYDLYQIPTQVEEKKLSVSSKSRDINHQNYFQTAAPDLKNIMKEIGQNKQASNEARLALLNNLLKYFTGRCLYLDPKIDQNFISDLDLIYNNQPTAQKITEWILNKRKGVCLEFGIAFYTLCCDLFPDWSFELHNGYTEAKNIITGIAHAWVVLNLPGKDPMIFDPTPSTDFPSERSSAEHWTRPCDNKFFLSHSRILNTIQEKIVPLLQSNELRSTQVIYRDKPGLLDFHLAARGVTQCFRINKGLQNHKHFPPVLIIDYPRCPTPKTLNSWVIDIYFWEQVMKQGTPIYLWKRNQAQPIKDPFDLIINLSILQKPEEKALKDWQEKQAQKFILFDQKKYQLIFSKLAEICKNLDDSAWNSSLLRSSEQKENKESKLLAKKDAASEDKLPFEFKAKETSQSFLKQWISIKDDDLKEEEFSGTSMVGFQTGKSYIYKEAKLAARPYFLDETVELYLYCNTRINQKLIDSLAMISEVNHLNLKDMNPNYTNFIYEELKIPAKFTKVKFLCCEFNQKAILHLFSHCACPKIEFSSCSFDKNIIFPKNSQITEISFKNYFEEFLQLEGLSQLNKLTLNAIEPIHFVNISNTLRKIKQPISLHLLNFYLPRVQLDLTSVHIEKITIISQNLSLVIDGLTFFKCIDQFLAVELGELVVVWEDKSVYNLIMSIIDKKSLDSQKKQLEKYLPEKEIDQFINLLLGYSGNKYKLKVIHRYEPLDIAQFVNDVNESLLDSSNNDIKGASPSVFRLG